MGEPIFVIWKRRQITFDHHNFFYILVMMQAVEIQYEGQNPFFQLFRCDKAPL